VTDLERVRADTLQDLGRLNDAAEGMRRAVASLSSDSTEQLRMGLLKDLGQLELMRGRANEAEGALSEAYMLARKVTGDENGYTWFVAGQWGKALAAQGRLRQAESIQREAVSQMVRIIGAAAYRNALVLEPLAETLSLQGAHVEAIRCAREALALSGRQYSPGHRITYSYRHTLAAALEASGTAEALHEAEQILDKAIADIPRSTDASNRVVLADMLYVRGRLHRRARQFDAASRDLEQALALMQNTGAAKSDVIATELARARQRI
jgi:tetratricopeptide (TPR) repeat protein